MALNFTIDDIDFDEAARELLTEYDEMDEDERDALPDHQDEDGIPVGIDDNGGFSLGHNDGETWGYITREFARSDLITLAEAVIDYDREWNPEDYEDKDVAA